MPSRLTLLRRASIIAIAGNLVLAVSKLLVGHLGGSLAVVGDGVDSAADAGISVMTLLVAGIGARPGDRDHPYGHARAETIATTVLAFVVFLAGAQLLWSAVAGMVEGVDRELPSHMAVVVTVVSIGGKLLLALSQAYYGRLTGSSMLMANARNMRMDILTSCSVLVGLFFAFVLKLPLLDLVTAAVVGGLIIRTAWEIFQDVNSELMEGGVDRETYGVVFGAALAVPAVRNPHRARIRRMGVHLLVDLDIEVKPTMTVTEAHKVATEVECAIKDRLPQVLDVMVHVEPEGAGCHGESYGLTPQDQPPEGGGVEE